MMVKFMRSKIKTAIIFCGGKGKRLYPITKKIPKPLVEIDSKPFIYYIIEQLISFKVKKIIFLTGYKSDLFKKTVNKFNKFKKKIDFVFKKTPVNWETSKRLNSIKSIKESFFLLLYSDNLVYFNYSNYLKSINKSKIVNLIVQNKLLAKEVGNIQEKRNKNLYSSERKKNYKYVELGYCVTSNKIFNYINNKNISFSATLEKLSIENNLGIYKVTNKYHSITNLNALKKSSKTLLKLRKKNLE